MNETSSMLFLLPAEETTSSPPGSSPEWARKCKNLQRVGPHSQTVATWIHLSPWRHDWCLNVAARPFWKAVIECLYPSRWCHTQPFPIPEHCLWCPGWIQVGVRCHLEGHTFSMLALYIQRHFSDSIKTRTCPRKLHFPSFLLSSGVSHTLILTFWSLQEIFGLHLKQQDVFSQHGPITVIQWGSRHSLVSGYKFLECATQSVVALMSCFRLPNGVDHCGNKVLDKMGLWADPAGHFLCS